MPISIRQGSILKNILSIYENDSAQILLKYKDNSTNENKSGY